MRTLFILIIGLHGLIHFLGFLKAFKLAEINELTLPISKSSGILWLVTSVVFGIATTLFTFRSNHWWIFGLFAVLLSQFLIIQYWTDAKFGTLANVIILFAIALSYSSQRFYKTIKEERTTMLEQATIVDKKMVNEEDVITLPKSVQNWLKASGIVGSSIPKNVYLTQELQLKLKPEDQKWMEGKAEQYFTLAPPTFNWSIHTKMGPGLDVVGRDKFENGQGEMLIKLLSIVPVADAKRNEKINQAALQRYLAEIVWFPHAALSNYIEWEEINESSAKATMNINGTTGSGTFYFDEEGQFKKFVAMRYKETNDQEPKEWTVLANKIEQINGIKVPTVCEVQWKINAEQWTWLKLRIKHIEYNKNR